MARFSRPYRPILRRLRCSMVWMIRALQEAQRATRNKLRSVCAIPPRPLIWQNSKRLRVHSGKSPDMALVLLTRVALAQRLLTQPRLSIRGRLILLRLRARQCLRDPGANSRLSALRK
jgi:hypothetical protein